MINRLLLVVLIISTLFAISCGGGDSGSGVIIPVATVADTTPNITTNPAVSTAEIAVSIIEGGIYIPASINGTPRFAATITPRAGYVPLSGANITLSGTNKQIVTNANGYFKFEIYRADLTETIYKTIVVTKPELNVNVNFDIQITSDVSKYLTIEVDTQTGEKSVKEITTSAHLAGTYNGSWELRSAPLNKGTVVFDIATDGVLKGVLNNSTTGDSAVLSGTIDGNGVYDSSYIYSKSGDTGTLTGILLKGTNNNYFSSISNKATSGQFTGEMAVTRN